MAAAAKALEVAAKDLEMRIKIAFPTSSTTTG